MLQGLSRDLVMGTDGVTSFVEIQGPDGLEVTSTTGGHTSRVCLVSYSYVDTYLIIISVVLAGSYYGCSVDLTDN